MANKTKLFENQNNIEIPLETTAEYSTGNTIIATTPTIVSSIIIKDNTSATLLLSTDFETAERMYAYSKLAKEPTIEAKVIHQIFLLQ